jgi:SWI/SNF-related matrix-associated actin-dependent regulator 1 of chromatin subfamily A
MTTIFDTIRAAAERGAAEGTVAHAIATSTFDGTRVVPTEGFVLPVAPATKTLYAYQLAAVESILGQRRVLLGLQPGLGKTAIMQAVVAAEAAQGKRSLVVVPPSLRISPWANEFAADYPHLTVAVVTGTKAAPLPDADVVILGDSVLAKRIDDIRAWAPSNVFADEAHRFKSRDAKRSKALALLADELPADGIVVAATGTVVANRVVDVYQPLRITGRENAKAVSGGDSWTRFMDAWCITETVWTGRANIRVAVGCSDPEGLREALVRSCYVSVPREAVLDLPERTTAVRSLVINGDAAEYRRAERDFLSWVRETKGDAAMHRAMKAEAVTQLMHLWEADGNAKAKASVEYIQSLVEQGEQVVVFAHHKSVVEALYSSLVGEARVVTIVGGMTSEAKAEAVDAFQSGNADVIIGNITAMGTGLTLHAAAHVVMVQLPWAPGEYGQATDRVYRIGQERHVTTHVLNMAEGVSERLWAILCDKAHVADAINTGTPSTIDPDSVISAVLEDYGW